jgi:serine/threonine protein phosphatase PrpC
VITCPNPSCQTPNAESNALCSHCHTAIPHRYLWAVGASGLPADLSLGSRYQHQQDRIFLDTQPGRMPEAEPDFPEYVLPYLYLSGYTLQIPRPYALVPQADSEPVLLLEAAAIVPPGPGKGSRLLPRLFDQWPDAPPLRQLHWLWQMVQLWPALESEQVASSLLNGSLVRVDGSILQLLELQPDDPAKLPKLKDLGAVWQPLAQQAHRSVRDFLLTLCDQLQQQTFLTAEPLVTCLDRALTIVGAGQSITCELAVLTDQGPTRQRNEDACYPASGSFQWSEIGPGEASHPLMMVVCDGIGGHQGGDVASKLAIATLQQRLGPLLSQPEQDSATVTLAIEQAICAANDEIAQQNDQEERHARDRMGTTLVMALVLGPHLYIAHIGDSRAYRINRHACRQVTLDDDVAAREVRLGYGFYREVVDHPGAGALVQALGMSHSQTLYPNVQRFTLDEDSVFLLCSDGLSDNDRVEQVWSSELLPVYHYQQTVLASAKNLVQLANTCNGHDNVTVGVLRCRITDSTAPLVPVAAADPAKVAEIPRPALPAKTVIARSPSPPPATQTRSLVSLVLGILGLTAVAGGLVTFFLSGTVPQPVPVSTPSPPADSVPPASLATGSYVMIAPSPESLLTLYAAPSLIEGQAAASLEMMVARLVPGTLVQILGKQESADQARWVQLKVCVPGNDRTAVASTAGVATAVTTGWVLESQLATVAQAVDDPASLSLGNCQPQ